MTVDRYTRVVLTVIGVALTVVALNPWIGSDAWLLSAHPRPAEAQESECPVRAGNITSSAGRFVGSYPSGIGRENANYFVFESTEGITLIDVTPLIRSAQALGFRRPATSSAGTACHTMKITRY